MRVAAGSPMQLPDDPAVFSMLPGSLGGFENVSGEVGPEDQGGGLGTVG